MRTAIVKKGAIVNFVEFESLEDAISFYSDEVVVVDATDIYCDIGWGYEFGQFIQPVIEVSLTEAIAQMQLKIQTHAQSLLEEAVAGYRDVERDTWFGKEREAVDFLASGDTSHCPYLEIEARKAGVPLEVLAQIVANKAVSLKVYTSVVLGNRSYHVRTVGSLQTVAEVLEYDYSQGWFPD